MRHPACTVNQYLFAQAQLARHEEHHVSSVTSILLGDTLCSLWCMKFVYSCVRCSRMKKSGNYTKKPDYINQQALSMRLTYNKREIED